MGNKKQEEKQMKWNLKERIEKYYKEDTNILHMSFDLFCLELNMTLGNFAK